MHGFGEPLGDRQSEAQAGTGVVVTEALEDCEHAVSLGLGYAGAVVGDVQTHMASRSARGRRVRRGGTWLVGVDPGRDVGRAEPARVVDEVGYRAFQQPRIGEHQRQVFGYVDGDVCR